MQNSPFKVAMLGAFLCLGPGSGCTSATTGPGSPAGSAGANGTAGSWAPGPNGVPDPSCIQGGECSVEKARCTPDSYDCSWCTCVSGHYSCGAWDVDWCGLPFAEYTPKEVDPCPYCVKGSSCSYQCGDGGANTDYTTFACGEDLKWRLATPCSMPAR